MASSSSSSSSSSSVADECAAISRKEPDVCWVNPPLQCDHFCKDLQTSQVSGFVAASTAAAAASDDSDDGDIVLRLMLLLGRPNGVDFDWTFLMSVPRGADDTDPVSLNVSTGWIKVQKSWTTVMTPRWFLGTSHNKFTDHMRDLSRMRLILNLLHAGRDADDALVVEQDPSDATKARLVMKAPVLLPLAEVIALLVRVTYIFPTRTWLAPNAPSREGATLFLNTLSRSEQTASRGQ